MKNKVITFGVICVLFSVMAFGFNAIPQPNISNASKYLATPSNEVELLRSVATETGAAAYGDTTLDTSFVSILVDETTLDATNGAIDVLKTFGFGANGVEIAFFSADADSANDTFDFELWAFSGSLYAPAEPIYATTSAGCVFGTKVCLKHPTTGATLTSRWCDTISGTDHWNGCSVGDSGNNKICKLRLDMRGRRYLFLRIFDAGGTGTESAGVGAIITGY